MQSTNKELINSAIEHFHKNDKVLSAIIDEIGPFRLELRRLVFNALIHAIISQQLSNAAASSIHSRFLKLPPSNRPSPTLVARTNILRLRDVGISSQKAVAIKNLAFKINSGEFIPRLIAKMDDEKAIEALNSI